MRVLFLSTNPGTGASEDLWVKTAQHLCDAGNQVYSAAPWSKSDRSNRRILQLEEKKVPFYDLSSFSLGHRIPYLSITRFWARNLRRLVSRVNPSLVILSNGTLVDCVPICRPLLEIGVPFVTLDHGIFESGWPSDAQGITLSNLYRNAKANFFVSEASLRLAETQLACNLPNAKIVRNPYLVDFETKASWPESQETRLACVGRILPRHKGQDLLLQLFSSEKWRNRPIHVNIYGSGPSREMLEKEAKRRNLTNLSFCGHAGDISKIWESHHALLLPSRQENLPVTIVEAMLCSRLTIATRVGGIEEVVRDGKEGFLADAATSKLLEQTLERAWEKRASWQQLGESASTRIRKLVPKNPPSVFAEILLSLGNELSNSAG